MKRKTPECEMASLARILTILGNNNIIFLIDLCFLFLWDISCPNGHHYRSSLF